MPKIQTAKSNIPINLHEWILEYSRPSCLIRLETVFIRFLGANNTYTKDITQ